MGTRGQGIKEEDKIEKLLQKEKKKERKKNSKEAMLCR